ncbi:MAG: chorismate synthase [Clostridiales bacterium]|nr:chorismate synthase [Clostridiales bacterium]
MKNTFGNTLTVTLFGESHGPCIGAVIDGLAPGIKIDEQYIAQKLSKRCPKDETATSRREPDLFEIKSGVFNGFTTGTPLCIIIPNTDTISKNYYDLLGKARPGHADYAAFCKYHGFEDARGGGHFSGRITASLVAAGAIISYALQNKGIYIGTHVKKCDDIYDSEFSDDLKTDISSLLSKDFPALSDEKYGKMREAVLNAKNDNDSVGGIIETAVIGMPKGVGEPWFDTVEGKLSHALFSVPAVKGVEFGLGFSFADKRASNVNDGLYIENGEIYTKTNNNGGINGGITNGMPVIFRCAIKPTPSISKVQDTVDYKNNENTQIEIHGRHDPCIAFRACPVIDAICAITLADLLVLRYGTDYLA